MYFVLSNVSEILKLALCQIQITQIVRAGNFTFFTGPISSLICISDKGPDTAEFFSSMIYDSDLAC